MNSFSLRDALKLLVPAPLSSVGRRVGAGVAQTAVLRRRVVDPVRQLHARRGELSGLCSSNLGERSLVGSRFRWFSSASETTKCAQIQKAQAVVPGSDVPARGRASPSRICRGKIGVSGLNTIGEDTHAGAHHGFRRGEWPQGREKDLAFALDESEFSLTPPGADEADATIDLLRARFDAERDPRHDHPQGFHRDVRLPRRSRTTTSGGAQRAGFKDMKSDRQRARPRRWTAWRSSANPDNPVGAPRSADQIAKIFRARISNSAEVGGLPGPINVNRRNDPPGTIDTSREAGHEAE